MQGPNGLQAVKLLEVSSDLKKTLDNRVRNPNTSEISDYSMNVSKDNVLVQLLGQDKIDQIK